MSHIGGVGCGWDTQRAMAANAEILGMGMAASRIALLCARRQHDPSVGADELESDGLEYLADVFSAARRGLKRVEAGTLEISAEANDEYGAFLLASEMLGGTATIGEIELVECLLRGFNQAALSFDNLAYLRDITGSLARIAVNRLPD